MSSEEPRKGLHVAMRWKLLAGFAGAFTIVFVFIAIWVFRYTTDTATSRLESQLRASAIGGAATINGDEFKKLVTTVPAVPDASNPFGYGYPDSPIYAQDAKELYQINQLIPQSQPYTYFRDPKDGKIYFGASAGFMTDPKQGVPYRVPAAEVLPPVTYSYFEKGLEQTTEQAPYTDDFGSWISAYSPIVDSAGNKVGAVGIDYPLTYVGEVQQSVQRQLYPVLVLSYVVLLLLVLLISTSLSRPLKRLSAATRRISDGEYDLDVQQIVKSRFPDEMYELANSVQVMARKIGARERSLTQEVQRLKVEIDETRREKAVREITETDFFSDLTAKAAEMRRRVREVPDPVET